MNKLTPLFLIFLFSSTAQVDKKSIDEKLLFTDKDETERWLQQKQIPALGIGFIKDGKIEQVSVFGELEKGRPAPKNTIWNVASLTKPITAMVALKLISAGKWSLDEPVYKYYTDPDVAGDPRSKKITTRHLLTHQAGFSNWRHKTTDGKLIFESDPGTKYRYSGEGYEYLRKALESKFHKPLDQLADELIFAPLKMKDTRFLWDPEMDSTRFAKWHDEKGALYKTYKNVKINAADDLLTTVEDYSRFLVHVMNGAGLSEQLFKEMTSGQARVNDIKLYGLGWLIYQNVNHKNDFALSHGGDDIGLHTIVFMVPASKKGLVIFTNCDNGTSAYKDVLLAYLGEEGQGIFDAEMK
jgi:CubicO group peptidase (beta-lactamase class C family)